MLILSSPSGAGKTSISKALLERQANLRLSISATTRPQRPGEVEGVDYFFVDDARFKAMITDGALLEYALVFKNYYGTPKAPVYRWLENGEDVLFDIDWQGAQQIKLLARKDMVSVFILPPSMQELRRRLIERAADSAETVAYRMTQALDEISHWGEYDYILINENFADSVAAIEAIMRAEKLRRSRQPELTGFVRDLRLEAGA